MKCASAAPADRALSSHQFFWLKDMALAKIIIYHRRRVTDLKLVEELARQK